MSHEWYIVRVLTNREERVRDNLVRRIKGDKLEHRIPQVLVPVEKVTEVKSGKKRVVNRKLYPGYLLVQADLQQIADAQSDQTVGQQASLGHGQGQTHAPSFSSSTRSALSSANQGKNAEVLAWYRR